MKNISLKSYSLENSSQFFFKSFVYGFIITSYILYILVQLLKWDTLYIYEIYIHIANRKSYEDFRLVLKEDSDLER